MSGFAFYDTGARFHDDGLAYSLRLWEITCLLEGEGELDANGTVSHIASGAVALVPPGMPHTLSLAADAKTLRLTFAPQMAERLGQVCEELEPVAGVFADTGHAWLIGKTAAAAVARLMRSMRDKSGAMRAVALIRILALVASSRNALVAGVSRYQIAGERKLDAAEEYIRTHYDREISLEEVARMVGMSRTSFCNFYKAKTGVTLVARLNAMRVEKACRLLIEGGRSMDEIARECGFAGVEYFSRVFSKLRGMPPARWRKAQGNG